MIEHINIKQKKVGQQGLLPDQGYKLETERIIRRVSLKLIKKAIDEDWIRQLSFFHLLKGSFNNSCIYNYRSRMNELACEFKISVRTLYRYFNFLRSKGLICDHTCNLKLLSIRSFSSRKKTVISIEEEMSLFDISCLLYCKIIEKRARQQAYTESIRRAQRGDKFIVQLCATPFCPSLSYRTLAKLLNTSECKAFKIMKNLARLGVIAAKNQKAHLVSNTFNHLESISDYPGYRYTINGRLFEFFGTRIDFLHFPIFLKKISVQQYRKFLQIKS